MSRGVPIGFHHSGSVRLTPHHDPERSPTAIAEYLAGLADRLRGPARARADLLDEARDSLLDAAEAHRAAGLAPECAARRAVAEFGGFRLTILGWSFWQWPQARTWPPILLGAVVASVGFLVTLRSALACRWAAAASQAAGDVGSLREVGSLGPAGGGGAAAAGRQG